ncbi:rhomboid family intramembrane serine protease [Desulfospira joergensenii]|uniref:rhomboid family intramembrane serine protease n=1 Tax=Desulfospira joergensenii TaxID=53329 RepID=UPI0003B30857|nr:rhomboid family intramembrane serine protease [Desulfospira joergensenii]
MKIKYNSPVVLTYALLALLCLILPVSGTLGLNFSSPSGPAFSSPLFYIRLFTHVFTHAGWSHLMGNLMIILLLGPLLEEKYRSWKLFEMMAVTAAATALLNAVLFHTSLIGGSGLAFMMILLSSFSNFRAREVPLTFILVAVIFIGSEVAAILKVDQISQFSHLAGGFTGAAYGFLRGGRR